MRYLSTKERYRKDAAYRAREAEYTKKYHEANKHSKNYRDLVALRKKIYRCKESIKNTQDRMHKFKERLKHYMYRKEVLELAWGKERADAKRSQIRSKSGEGSVASTEGRMPQVRQDGISS